MALVLLPCDLPTWPTVQRYLNQLKVAKNAEKVVELMIKLQDLCCISLDSDDDNLADSRHLKVFQSFLENVLIDEEKQQFFDVILPSLVENALKLKSLRPINGLLYSLQQQAEEFSIERRLIQSLLSHAFFSTFPKRNLKTHPTLQNFNFSEFFMYLNSASQQAKLRSFFRYFEVISKAEIFSQGNVQFIREVSPNWKNLTLEDWLTSELPLCPLTLHHEGNIADIKGDVIHVCFSSPRIGGHVLTDGCNQEEINFFTCPEVMVSLLFVEKLEENEVLIVQNYIRVGVIQDGKRFVSQENPITTYGNHLCLIDAENFENDPNVQYEEKHIIRELIKAFTGFHQTRDSRRLSPLGESCTTPPPEMWYSVCGTLNQQENEDENSNFANQRRPTLIGQSFNSLSESKKLNSLDEKRLLVPGLELKGRLLSQESDAEFKDAVSYPWQMQQSFVREGDDVWFTPMEPPKLTINEMSLSSEDSLKLSKKLNKSSIDSVISDEEFQSCDEDENPGTSIPKIVTGPVTSTGRVTLISQHAPLIKRNLSSQSEDTSQSDENQRSRGSSSDVKDEEEDEVQLHRVPSTGFLLDEDDFFVGDGLEAEQEWLRQFRNRSMSRSVSGISRRNSSRYSFSSDFSSDLDEIYEHFEEMMAKGPVTDDPQVAKYVGGILKRTLSDSLTAARQRCTAGEGLPPRSLSLADHLTQERQSLERAKQAEMAAAEGISMEQGGKRKLSGHLVSIVIEQTLAEMEAKLDVELPKEKSDEVRKTIGKLCTQINRKSSREEVEVDNDDVFANVNCSCLVVKSDDYDELVISDDDCRSSCSNLDGNYISEDGSISGERRLSCSEPDLRFLKEDNHSTSYNPDFMRKWNATSNLFETESSLPSTPPQSSRPRSKSSAIKTRSLESICSRFWDTAGRNSDSDQFWLLIKTNQGSLEDVLSVDDDEETVPRRRVNSLGSSSTVKLNPSDLFSVKRSSSDSLLTPCKSLQFSHMEEEESKLKFQDSHRISILSDHFPQLQVITEVPQEEVLTPELSRESLEPICAQSNSSVNLSSHQSDEKIVVKNDDSKSGTSNWNLNQDSRTETPVNIHGFKPLVTGNWGCGRFKGDHQLKAVIQWMAASRAEIPNLIYCTQKNQHIVKLDTVNRVLRDRHWTVGTLMKVLTNYCKQRMENKSLCLFDAILPRDSH